MIRRMSTSTYDLESRRKWGEFEMTRFQKGLERQVDVESVREEICANIKSRSVRARSRLSLASAKQETTVFSTSAVRVSPRIRVTRPDWEQKLHRT